MTSRQIAPELLDYSAWPQVDPLALEPEERMRFVRISGAVKAASDGMKTGAIKARFGISASLLNYYLKRCTGLHPDGRVRGFRALVAPTRYETYVRKKAVEIWEDGAGLAGAFGLLLREVEGLADWIRAQLKPDDGKTPQVSDGKIKNAGLNVAAIWTDMLDFLRKRGRRPDQYPFIAERHGYVTLCSYVRDQIAAGNDDAARSRYGDSAVEGRGRNSGKKSLLRPIQAFERCGYDEYQIPDIDTIAILTEGQEIEVSLSRGWFCPVVDFESEAVLGWTLTITDRFQGLDLLTAVENSIRPPPRVQCAAFSDLEPLPDEGLPAAVIPVARGRRICNLVVDNHLTHSCNAVVGELRVRTGMLISFGKVHSWIERAVVERVFSELQSRLKRLASTTGSGPQDPTRRDAVGRAVKYKIRFSHLFALIDQIVARRNAERRRSLAMSTPNERIASQWADQARLSILPQYCKTFLEDPCLAVKIFYCAVRGSRKNHQPPYVQVEGQKYSNEILKQSWNMVNKECLIVHVRGDARTARAFRADGTEFGVVHLSGRYARSAHTLDTRKEIEKRYRLGKLARGGDPVVNLQRKLAAEALKDAQSKRRKKISRAAGKLAETMMVSAAAGQPPDVRYQFDPIVPASLTNARPSGRRSFFSEPDGDGDAK